MTSEEIACEASGLDAVGLLGVRGIECDEATARRSWSEMLDLFAETIDAA